MKQLKILSAGLFLMFLVSCDPFIGKPSVKITFDLNIPQDTEEFVYEPWNNTPLEPCYVKVRKDFVIPGTDCSYKKRNAETKTLDMIFNFFIWNSAPDGSGTDYYPGYKVIFGQDTVLYAKYKDECPPQRPDGVVVNVTDWIGLGTGYKIKACNSVQLWNPEEKEYSVIQDTEAVWIDENNILHALAPGQAKIWLTVKESSLKFSLDVEVTENDERDTGLNGNWQISENHSCLEFGEDKCTLSYITESNPNGSVLSHVYWKTTHELTMQNTNRHFLILSRTEGTDLIGRFEYSIQEGKLTINGKILPQMPEVTVWTH